MAITLCWGTRSTAAHSGGTAAAATFLPASPPQLHRSDSRSSTALWHGSISSSTPWRCRRLRPACATGGASESDSQLPSASRWKRFVGFVQAGDAKEAWLSISDNILAVTLPTALLALALHGSLWGSTPPPAVVAAEAAVAAGAAIATATAVWKILEGFQG
ncbi:hypothetical protein ACK3TF_003199 [Chlorella vulgaris]